MVNKNDLFSFVSFSVQLGCREHWNYSWCGCLTIVCKSVVHRNLRVDHKNLKQDTNLQQQPIH